MLADFLVWVLGIDKGVAQGLALYFVVTSFVSAFVLGSGWLLNRSMK